MNVTPPYLYPATALSPSRAVCFYYVLLLTFFLSFMTTCAFCQAVKEVTLSDSFLQHTYGNYMDKVGGSANLYNGPEYTGSYPQTEGSPYWNSPDLQRGTICYDGVLYYDVPMAYDLVRNEVLIKGYQQLATKLDDTKVSFFLLSGHTYVRINSDTAAANEIQGGFYDLIYNGAIKLYVKRSKRVERSFHAENPYQFVSYAGYFILKDKAYYRIAGKKDLLTVFKEESRLLKAFWKEKGLNFKMAPEEAIVQTVSYYTGLKK